MKIKFIKKELFWKIYDRYPGLFRETNNAPNVVMRFRDMELSDTYLMMEEPGEFDNMVMISSIDAETWISLSLDVQSGVISIPMGKVLPKEIMIKLYLMNIEICYSDQNGQLVHFDKTSIMRKYYIDNIIT